MSCAARQAAHGSARTDDVGYRVRCQVYCSLPWSGGMICAGRKWRCRIEATIQ